MATDLFYAREQISRCKYLRNLKQARDIGMNLIYLDKTWINSHHTIPKEWVSNEKSMTVITLTEFKGMLA